MSSSFTYSREYKRDLRKLAQTPELLMSSEFIEVMYLLERKMPLPEKYKDHALKGEWEGYRDCHIRNDLVLIYRLDGDNLYLARLNSHSELFG